MFGRYSGYFGCLGYFTSHSSLLSRTRLSCHTRRAAISAALVGALERDIAIYRGPAVSSANYALCQCPCFVWLCPRSGGQSCDSLHMPSSPCGSSMRGMGRAGLSVSELLPTDFIVATHRAAAAAIGWAPWRALVDKRQR